MKRMLKLIAGLLLALCLLMPAFALAETYDVSLTVDKTQMRTWEECVLQFRAAQADEAYLYRTDSYEQNALVAHCEGIHYEDGVISGWEYAEAGPNPGTVSYRLRARYGQNWVEKTAEIKVTAPNGPMVAPAVYVSARQKLGQDVDFTVELPSTALNWYIQVLDEEGNEVASFATLQQTDYTVPAEKLTTATYRIIAKTGGIGYAGFGEASAEFHVGPPGRTITLTARKNAYFTYEDAVLNVHAPEADEVILDWGYSQMHWEHAVDADVSVPYPSQGFDGTLKFILRARYGDEWVESKEASVSYTAPNGDRPELNIHVPQDQPKDQPLHIAIDPIDGVTSFFLQIIGPEGNIVYETEKWQESIDIPASKLVNGYYELSAYVFAKGYLYDALDNQRFHVGEVDRTVRLEIDHFPVLTWEPYSLRCYAPEALETILYEITDDEPEGFEVKHWHYYPVNEVINEPALISTTAVRGYLLMGRFEDDTWEESQLIVMAAAPYGEKPALNIRAQASYGKDQAVRIPIESERKLVYCTINILDTADRWVRGMEGYDEESQVYTIPAGALAPGRYQIEVNAGAVGYANRTVQRAAFTVGKDGRELGLKISPEHPVTGAGYTVEVSAPFADEWELLRRDGDKAEYSFYSWDAGAVKQLNAQSWGDKTSEYRIRARFGKEWAESPVTTVTYSAPNGDMPAPVIHAQKSYPVGEEVFFTLDTVEDPILLNVVIRNKAGKQVYDSDYAYAFEHGVSGLPAGAYTIQVEASGRGYVGFAKTSASFRVVSNSSKEPLYEITDFAYDGTAVTGKLKHISGDTLKTRQMGVRVTFFVTGNYYMATVAQVEADGEFEVEGVGPIEYITALAYCEADGERTNLDAADIIVN